MKRNHFGINLDEGIPLSTEMDFQKLYVPCFEDMADKVNSWIKDDLGKNPLMLGGQIGSGKSTLIAKTLLKSLEKEWACMRNRLKRNLRSSQSGRAVILVRLSDCLRIMRQPGKIKILIKQKNWLLQFKEPLAICSRILPSLHLI